MAVTVNKADLEFILAQIQIAEAHAAGAPLFGPGGLVPAYNLSMGLRTVDGTYNNLLHPRMGCGRSTVSRRLWARISGLPTARLWIWMALDRLPPMPTAPNYNPSNNPNSIVVDSSLRTISNLIVDQTLGNPSAILTAVQRAGSWIRKIR